MTSQLVRDLGAKVSADVSAAIHRALALTDDPREKYQIAIYAATIAFGAAAGAVAAASGSSGPFSEQQLQTHSDEVLRVLWAASREKKQQASTP